MQKFPKCRTCGKEHALGGCPEFQSTAARKIEAGYAKEEHRVAPETVQVSSPAPATNPPPKPKIGRPRTGFNKKEYNRQFTADLRTIKRLGLNCTVAQY